jgi:DMSO/TMAO reductase YedYZ molybdopterin-dependent catalytic subunit
MKRRVVLMSAVAGLVALPSAWSQAARAASGVVLLRVAGLVQSPLNLTREELGALRWRDYAEQRSVEQDGRSVKVEVRYQGFPLRELLDLAVLAPDRRALRRAIVLLTARDGYQTTFSWGELYNSALGDGVILVREQDGRDLIEADGLPALRSLQDIRSGPRHVRWLERIEVLWPAGS